MARTRKPRFMDHLMAEPIRLPGVLGVVVTRHFAYQWLRACGYDDGTRGFGSIDYMVFHQKPVAEPLTDVDEPDMAHFLAHVQQSIRRDCIGVA